MESQDKLLSTLGVESIIAALRVPPGMSVEQLVDARESDHFSEKWMVAFNLIEAWKRNSHEIESDLSIKIREAAYLQAYSRWKSVNLAAYISDDFGLMADAATVGAREPWIEDMLRKYRNGEIPITS